MVLGLRPVTHRGIVSAITPIAIPQISPKLLDAKMIKQLRDPYDVFQLDATAYPGNSGSPVYVPETGAVIGVINKVFVKESKEAVLEKPSGITYAIPVQYVRELLRDAGVVH
jgi:serine protease Do